MSRVPCIFERFDGPAARVEYVPAAEGDPDRAGIEIPAVRHDVPVRLDQVVFLRVRGFPGHRIPGERIDRFTDRSLKGQAGRFVMKVSSVVNPVAPKSLTISRGL